jgi:outer membrane beta-barrel protein
MRACPTPALLTAGALALGLVALAGAPDSARAEDQRQSLRTTQLCIDKEIADRLAVKRKRRGAVDRLFVKQGRHEMTAFGGYYVSDLFSSTWSVGGAYTYHMAEDTAVEFGFHYTHANADVIRAIEEDRGVILDDDYASVRFAESLLLWSPIYGKFRLGGTIMRFDIHLDAGVGVVDSPTSRGAAGVGGIGVKLFVTEAIAFRIDARDHVFRQELLDERFLVNDTSVTAGLSLFLPFHN